MKILFATDTYFPHVNGTAYFIYRMASDLAKRGHKVYVVAPSVNFSNTIFKQKDGVTVFGLRSFPVIKYPYFRLATTKMSKGKLEKFILDSNPDVVHIQQHFQIGNEVFKIARKHNIPVMGTNHFLPENLTHFFHLPNFAEKKLMDYGWKQFIKVYEELSLVTTPTKTAAEIIKEVGFEKEVVAVSNGIDTQRFSPKNNGDYLRKKLKLANRKTILFVGRLDKEKRIGILMQALVEVVKKCDTQLLIVGVGQKENELKKQAKELGVANRVIFTGFVSDLDLPNVLTLGDVFAIAGVAELQSIATMEAMATGLPVVATAYKALPELVHHGKNGYLFGDDYKEAAKYLVKILTNDALRKKMGRESLNIIKNHSVEHTLETFEGLYKRAIIINGQRSDLVEKKTLLRKSMPLSFAFFGALVIFGVVLVNGGDSDVKAYVKHPRRIVTKVDEIATRNVDRVKVRFNKIEQSLK
jgi:glycosyltransferase involved in cell wall biosynthesis